MTAEELGRFSAVKTSLRLGEGETEAFVLAVSRNWTVATDDGPARKRFLLADDHPPVTGTIGLLRLLVAEGRLTKAAAADLLRLIRERGGRLPDEEI
jgi:predicted nucleic acid-binding protein